MTGSSRVAWRKVEGESVTLPQLRDERTVHDIAVRMSRRRMLAGFLVLLQAAVVAPAEAKMAAEGAQLDRQTAALVRETERGSR